jgi:hypothetical protein
MDEAQAQTKTKGGFMKQLRSAHKKETCSEADHDSLLELAFLKKADFMQSTGEV